MRQRVLRSPSGKGPGEALREEPTREEAEGAKGSSEEVSLLEAVPRLHNAAGAAQLA